jgi:hypothetical protein
MRRAWTRRTRALLPPQSSVAAYTLGGDGELFGGAASAIARGPGPAMVSSTLAASVQHSAAHVAALRRAADLLAACAAARRGAAGGGGGVAGDGTMALCRKLFFSGGPGAWDLGAGFSRGRTAVAASSRRELCRRAAPRRAAQPRVPLRPQAWWWACSTRRAACPLRPAPWRRPRWWRWRRAWPRGPASRVCWSSATWPPQPTWPGRPRAASRTRPWAPCARACCRACAPRR